MASYRSPISSMKSGRPRRPMDWYAGSVNGAVAATSSNVGWAILPSQLHPETDPTLMALRISATIRLGQTAVNGSIVGVGIIAHPYLTTAGVASDALPGAANFPTPVTMGDADWAYLWLCPEATNIALGTICDNQLGPQGLSLSKARRRLGNNQSLLVVIQTISLSVDYHIHVRSLIKE